MKRFNDLTEKEINGLSQDEIQKFIDIECAENGLKIVECPKLLKRIAPEKDNISYAIDGGCNSIYVRFSDKDEAENIVNELNKCASIQKGTYDSVQLFYVKPVKEYLPETEVLAKKIEKENKEEESEYQFLMNEYDLYIEALVKISTPIYDKINNVRLKYESMEYIKCEYINRYLPLSENNPDVAMRFLKNTFTVDKETESYVLSNETPTV